MSHLLRVVLPDRPGALGAVASALGEVGGDILSVDVVERASGSAVDDLVVELPPGRLADALVTAASALPGVHVESIRPYAGRIDPHRELELLDVLATGPDEPWSLLADGVARIFRAGWALVFDAPIDGSSGIRAASKSAPELPALPVPWWPPSPARPLRADGSWTPPDWERLGTELAVSPLGKAALLVGRPGLPWLPSEVVRLQHLAAIASTVTATAAPISAVGSHPGRSPS
jgi:hypothetical protein